MLRAVNGVGRRAAITGRGWTVLERLLLLGVAQILTMGVTLTTAILVGQGSGQQPMIDLAGHAGWVGTGLLGAILAWLCWIHLPGQTALMERLIHNKDEQLNLMLEHHKGAIIGLSTDHREAVKALGIEFRTVIQETAAHCDKEVSRLIEFIRVKEEKIDALNSHIEKR